MLTLNRRRLPVADGNCSTTEDPHSFFISFSHWYFGVCVIYFPFIFNVPHYQSLSDNRVTMAELAARLLHDRKVVGSNPAGSLYQVEIDKLV